MSKCFKPANILLPQNCQMEKWAVIACDQFTSDPAYWARVKQNASDAPSTLHMILPEIDLAAADQNTIASINACMTRYLSEGVFREYSNAYVYVERTMQNGTVRQGIIGMVDLEHYHYDPKTQPMISATEKTVMERIPPRVAVRRDAALEFTHVLMLCDDTQFSLIEPVGANKEKLVKLYDFDLMENGGHIAGWLLAGADAVAFEEALDRYELEKSYLVGDGNHSLVTAKHCYEDQKALVSEEEASRLPARFAMVELENVHSPTMVFEPIHRIIVDTTPEQLLEQMQCICGDEGEEVCWTSGGKSGAVRIKTGPGELTVGVLQQFLDSWLEKNEGVIDYVHGEDTVEQLAQSADAIGFFMPKMKKSILFPYVHAGNILPRKMFSMGHGAEKRYYLEGRKIR